jgi:cytochrome c-type biogenesis protein CcmH/NrfG
VGDEAADVAVAPRGAALAPGGVTRRAGRWVVVAGLLVGVAIGAWFAGRASVGGEAPGASTTATAVAPDTATAVATATSDPAERIAELETGLAADPDDTDALLELGVLLFEEGDYAGAGVNWLRVTQVEPDNAAAWFNLGFYYLSTDPADTAAARAAWEKVLELEPDSDMAATVESHMDSFLAEAGEG